MYNELSGTRTIKNLASRFLEDNVDIDVPLRVIREYIYGQTGSDFSHGMYSSAMRDLIEESNGRILNTDRGMYRYVSDVKKREINDILDRCIKELKDAGYVNYLMVDNKDLEYINKIPKIVDEIEKLKLK
ncbi:hypothetical protein [Staphylococcus haemolyticus]|uniref:hypothetical protein n=1 Tax=Staphylococcus haemolyticus TaxID=1283 RepID=UPI0034DDC98F